MAGAPYLQACRQHDDVSPTSAKAVDMSRESARGAVSLSLPSKPRFSASDLGRRLIAVPGAASFACLRVE